ncbi:hypothetical protein EVAR_92992_1 [Eumeta japonica]|uniref:Uncharacterized protein n=1 Tax=Eumeta variegata TaxID=151549 RepID=A0A4C1TAI1_EUMVA|nr:hypothetical protein EVAR_92992_1 [Eumeta japonica]
MEPYKLAKKQQGTNVLVKSERFLRRHGSAFDKIFKLIIMRWRGGAAGGRRSARVPAARPPAARTRVSTAP